MKIKILHGILIVDILTILLVLAIFFTPSTIARVILGLPFVLYFPGYALVSALFPKKEATESIERIALSIGMSIAIVALIGLCLNYTTLGIRLEPVLYSVGSFIILMSVIALIRRAMVPNQPSLNMELALKFSGWQGNIFSKSVTVILALAVVGALVVLGNNIAAPQNGEKFTEFYALGLNGKAQSYPTEFLIDQGKITGVSYDAGTTITDSNQGTVTLGIINHERQKATYSVMVMVDGKQVDVNYAGKTVDRVGPIELQQGEKWEQKLGFTPQHTGDNQKVEFLLYKGSDPSPYNSLHLWVSVKASG